ncbi:hypothetical protein B0H13DRAFT_1897916 [Mycena leptocephala]|nr:hypothetical protein B0H13DRAFT_1897916 [Mycena leptocephala]
MGFQRLTESPVDGLPEPLNHSAGITARIHLRALNEGGQEVSELLAESDSKNSDLDSDVEVTAALIQASSPASSIIPQADAMDADNSDCKDVDDVPELAVAYGLGRYQKRPLPTSKLTRRIILPPSIPELCGPLKFLDVRYSVERVSNSG